MKKPIFEGIRLGHFQIKIGHYPNEVKYSVIGPNKKSIKWALRKTMKLPFLLQNL